jgi:hypothetical protein
MANTCCQVELELKNPERLFLPVLLAENNLSVLDRVLDDQFVERQRAPDNLCHRRRTGRILKIHHSVMNLLRYFEVQPDLVIRTQ